MAHKQTQLTDITVNSAHRTVWRYLTDQYNLRRLIEATLGAGVVFEHSADPYEGQDKPLFRAHASSDDLLLSADGCSIALRVSAESNKSTRIIAAASFSDDASVQPSKQMLNNLLERVRRDTEYRSGALDAPADTASRRQVFHAPSGSDAPTVPSQPGVTADTAHRRQVFHAPSGSDTPTAPSQSDVTAVPAAENSAKKRGKKSWIIALAAVVVLVLLAVWLLPSLRPTAPDGTVQPDGYSDKVTLDNVLALELGASENEVKKTLGTSGAGAADGRLYTGRAADSDSYNVLVQIQYTGGKAQKITYLDTVQCAVSGTFDYPVAYDAMADVAGIEASMGRKASMVRRYRQNDADLTEVHFGYLDPFSNFDPAWRGEYVLVQDHAAGLATIEYWATTDGADPLMIPQLDGHPVQNQYNDYTTFLNDKYSFEKAMFMLAGYSQGDVRRLYGDYELYSTAAGVALNRLDSQEKLADGNPAWRMSFGFDSRGMFVISSYTNLRLLHKADMLADSKYTDVTRGMSYGEVRDLMGILPTTLVIDKNYFTLCYGEKLERDVFEEQYEFMVKFDKNNNYAQNLWDNTARDW